MQKRTIAAFLALATVASNSASAAAAWIGNVYVHHDRRGSQFDVPASQTPLVINISDYDRPTVNFEYYKAGVTNTGGEVWKRVDARAVVIQENGETLAGGPALVVGQKGNNAVYRVEFKSLLPKKVPRAHTETFHANLDIMIDGERALSLPIDYVDEP